MYTENHQAWAFSNAHILTVLRQANFGIGIVVKLYFNVSVYFWFPLSLVEIEVYLDFFKKDKTGM